MLQTKLKVLDLFSGIGGFSLGLESTGFFETIAFVEKDEFCQKVLNKNFNNIPIEGDIRNVKGDKYKADVVTGGFPCQPFSVAGKRKGTDDDRYLWDETIRVVRECKPKWFIGENVEGLVNIQEGMVLRQVQDDLEKEGFEVQCIIIPASGIGAWHQRKRIWIIGCNDIFGKQKNLQHTHNERFEELNLSTEPKKSDINNREYDSTTENKTWWQTQSDLCGVPNGVSYGLDKNRANRIKALGNSIVPQIARELGKAIIESEKDV
jgi:DNA (cytosine-5)-methyltransferase 1